MPRQARAKGDPEDDAGPERRCIVTGEVRPRQGLLRFVASPEGRVTFDLLAKLPGRGMWVTASRPIVEQAIAKKQFARAAKRQVTVPEGLADLVESQLRQHALNYLALGRNAGMLVGGFEKVGGELRKGKVAVLLHAEDAARDGRAKLDKLADEHVTVISAFSREALAQHSGDAASTHLAMTPSGIAGKFIESYRRWAGFTGNDGL